MHASRQRLSVLVGAQLLSTNALQRRHRARPCRRPRTRRRPLRYSVPGLRPRRRRDRGSRRQPNCGGPSGASTLHDPSRTPIPGLLPQAGRRARGPDLYAAGGRGGWIPTLASAAFTAFRSSQASFFLLGIAQQVGRVERRHQRDALVAAEAAAQPRDRRVVAQQALRRELAQRDDHPRPDRRELPLQERLAAGDLVGLGVAVAGRAALQDVADVDVARARSPSPRSSSSAAGPPCRRTARPARPRRRPAPRRRTPGRRRGCRRRTRCSCAPCASLQRWQSPSSSRTSCSPACPVRGFRTPLASRRRGLVGTASRLGRGLDRGAPRRAAAVGAAAAADRRRRRLRHRHAHAARSAPRASRFVRSWPTSARSSRVSSSASSAATRDPASAAPRPRSRA